MASMYETIMELPLFKGIGEEQLSLLLEKTSVEFLKFEEGTTIAEPEETVRSVDFILNGRVRQTYKLVNYAIEIDEILSRGAVIGALHLFGMETNYTSYCVATSRVSIMRISKADYMNILLSDKIYLLNFVNYLSAASQKTPSFMRNVNLPSIGRSLKTLAFTFTSRRAETVMIAGEDSILAQYCGVSVDEFQEWKSTELSHNRIISIQRGIILKSPHLLR